MPCLRLATPVQKGASSSGLSISTRRRRRKSSPLREGLGIAARTRTYDQTAIVGNVAVDGPNSNQSQAPGTTAYERFTIPPAYRTIRETTVTTLGEIERAFIAANPTLRPDRLSVVCDGKALREIRLCLDKALQPRACRDGGRDRCPGRGITVFPRGSSPD